MQDIQFLDSQVKMPLMTLPVRTAIVTLSNAKVLISPGSKLSDEQYQSLGQITDIVLPNKFHRGGKKTACKNIPNATVWNPEDLNEKTWPYQNELEIIPLQGIPKINELVFYHKKSQSLIVADLLFNLVNAKGLGAWVILNIFGTYKKLGISRFFLKFAEDKTAFKNSLKNVMLRPFKNLIVCHGDNIIGNAHDAVQKCIKERGLS